LEFAADFLNREGKQVLLIAGAGFDPRSLCACRAIAAPMEARLRGLFIRENRPNASQGLIERANANLKCMTSMVPTHRVIDVDIFAADGAVVGGRNVAREVSDLNLDDATDVIIDFSSLSIGVGFPMVRQLLARTEAVDAKLNLHLLTVQNPSLDEVIQVVASDDTGAIHGFRGKLGLQETVEAAKLWLPQLVRGQRPILNKIYRHLEPHDVCPVLPFPASSPRLPDELVKHYLEEFSNLWGVDPQNIVYADENSALDLYRTILRIDDARRRVFEGIGGSLLIISPLGSKLLAIGALMAAIERDFPIVYVEPLGYEINGDKFDRLVNAGGELVHIWLSGSDHISFD